MRLLPLNSQPEFSRPGGRTFKEIIKERIGNIHSPDAFVQVVRGQTTGGYIDTHKHGDSIEIFIFPEGGQLCVNDEVFNFSAWDAILLEPGDTHGYSGSSSISSTHIAIRIGPENDKHH